MKSKRDYALNRKLQDAVYRVLWAYAGNDDNAKAKVIVKRVLAIIRKADSQDRKET